MSIMINPWILSVFLLDTLPFSYFLYVFLKKDLRYKTNGLIFFLWILVTVVVGVGCFALTTLPFYNEDVLRFLRLLNCYLLFFLLLLSSKTARAKVVFIFSVTLPFSLGFSIVAIYISKFIRITAPLYMVSSIIRFLLIIILYPVMIWMWHKLCAYSDRITEPTVWRYLWLIPASAAISELVLMDRNFETKGISTTDMIGRVVLWFGSIAVCWLLVFLAGRFEMRIHLQDAKERNEALLELQRQQYAKMAERIERTRVLRHDMRHHINAVNSLVNAEEYDKLKAYLTEISDTIEQERHITICENYAANAIMDSYIRRAGELDIPIKINFRLSNSSGISDGDLCVLLGNIVENAIEAAEGATGSNRFITISALEESDRIYMTFDNGYSGELKSQGDLFLSKKRNFAVPGIGLSSIKAIVKKYEGDIKLETDNNIFKISILLMKPEG